MAKKLVPVTGTAPSAWASYLIDGDASGISEEDIKLANRFVEWMGASIVDCIEVGFLHYCDGLHGVGADCCEYTAFIIQEE